MSINIDYITNKKHGNYFEGVYNIILNNLKPLYITKRPIHCNNTKLSKLLTNDAKEGWTENNCFKMIKKQNWNSPLILIIIGYLNILIGNMIKNINGFKLYTY